MPNKGHVPIRTCVACRRKFPKKELIRFILAGEEIILDERATHPGRGAYLCQECLPLKDSLKVLSKLERALRRKS